MDQDPNITFSPEVPPSQYPKNNGYNIIMILIILISSISLLGYKLYKNKIFPFEQNHPLNTLVINEQIQKTNVKATLLASLEWYRWGSFKWSPTDNNIFYFVDMYSPSIEIYNSKLEKINHYVNEHGIVQWSRNGQFLLIDKRSSNFGYSYNKGGSGYSILTAREIKTNKEYELTPQVPYEKILEFNETIPCTVEYVIKPSAFETNTSSQNTISKKINIKDCRELNNYRPYLYLFEKSLSTTPFSKFEIFYSENGTTTKTSDMLANDLDGKAENLMSPLPAPSGKLLFKYTNSEPTILTPEGKEVSKGNRISTWAQNWTWDGKYILASQGNENKCEGSGNDYIKCKKKIIIYDVNNDKVYSVDGTPAIYYPQEMGLSFDNKYMLVYDHGNTEDNHVPTLYIFELQW